MTIRTVETAEFSADLEFRDGYLRARVYGGVDSLEVSTRMWRLLADECRRVSTRRLLVVEDLAGAVPPEEFPALIAAIAGIGLEGVRIAFVDMQSDDDANEQCEILAIEQGFSALVFSDERTARHWLLYGGEDEGGREAPRLVAF